MTKETDIIATHHRTLGLVLRLLALSMLYWVPAQAQQYTLTELDSPGGSYASGINTAGQVVGISNTAGNTNYYATLWNGTTAADLGGHHSSANAINSAGQVVGVASTGHATEWNGTAATDLGTLGGSFSQAFGINSAGQVVGYATATGDAAQHAVLWNGTTATDLGTLGGTNSFAYGLNDAGQVVGDSDIAGNATSHATLWNGTTATDLGTLGGTGSVAWSINNAGQVVGDATTAGNAHTHATLWSGGKAIDLNSELTGSLAPYVTLTDANAINDNGQIAASGSDSRMATGVIFLLTPTSVPLPAAAWLLLSGLSGIGALARRRGA